MDNRSENFGKKIRKIRRKMVLHALYFFVYFVASLCKKKKTHHLDVLIVPTDKWQDFKLKYKFIFEYASPSSLREMFNVARRTSAEQKNCEFA